MDITPANDKNWHNKNIVKLRDYKEPTELIDIGNGDLDDLRNTIEPWLTALFQSEHLSLLTGAGISTAVHLLATGKNGAGMGNMKISQYAEEIEMATEE